MIVSVLDGLRSSVLVEDLDRVERSLVASGSGAIAPETEGLPGAGIAFAPELLRQQGIQWKARLAPDGTAPGETPPERRSWLTFGNLSNGGYSLNGWFTTLDRAIVSNVFDAFLSAAAANPVPGAENTATPVPGTTRVFDSTPRARVAFRETESNDKPASETSVEVVAAGEVGEVGDRLGSDPPDPLSFDPPSPDVHDPCPQQPDDTRSRSEKQAGILRAVFEAAARHPGAPTMGGAAPTVLVRININDLLTGRGAGWIGGIDGPLTTTQVDELICAGGYQPVLFGHNGKILHLGTSNRFFTAQQRRALAVRDGGCVIPGCTVPPQLTQVHHLKPWREGGRTDIDNGKNRQYDLTPLDGRVQVIRHLVGIGWGHHWTRWNYRMTMRRKLAGTRLLVRLRSPSSSRCCWPPTSPFTQSQVA